MPKAAAEGQGEWRGGDARRRRWMMMLAAAACASAVVLAVAARASARAAHERAELWGGAGAGSGRAGADGEAARRPQLASFDPATLYTDPAETDVAHGNRIDSYDCLFSDCEGQKTPLLQTIGRLKRLLGRLDTAQQKFIHDLDDKPVQTSMKVVLGEPGRLGARGDRGAVGPRGRTGETGATGRQGVMGRPGPPGDEGPRGRKGREGRTGARGRRGVQGLRGGVGPRGAQGQKGPRGETGPQGYPGDNGPGGLDGQKGGKGKPGMAPAGPPGPPGPQGARGPKGDRGAKGARGAEGATGPPGPQGRAGIEGLVGPFGKDAKKLPVPVCKGQTSSHGQTICHGFASVAWHTYYTGAYIDVDTRGCKWSSNDVQYFTFLTGNGWIEALTGGSSIYSPTKNGFRLYVATDTYKGLPWPVAGWSMNQWRLRVSWVGVGKSSGPKSTAVCCGTGSNSWGDAWWQGVNKIDAGACKMKGTPAWITAGQGFKSFGTSQVVGSNGAYNVGDRFATQAIRRSDKTWGYISGQSVQSNVWNPKYCLFGEPFPSGDQLVNDNQISQEEYPCDGMRVVSVKPPGQVKNLGWSGCSSSTPCAACAGDCDSDSDCAGHLKCFQRNGNGQRVPGCSAAGLKSSVDYCYDPNHNQATVRTNTATMCCGKTGTQWKTDAKGQLSMTVDTSSCNFKDDDVVYITSLGGSGHHWRTTGSTGYESSGRTQFVTKLRMHPTQYSPAQARTYNWHINWCGVGNAGTPK